MANTRIVHKRSATNSTIPALFQGELCYSQNGTGQSTTNSGLLYIGQPSDNAARIIGGTYAFGVLTANQAIVTNATSYVDQIKVGALTVSNISANTTWGGAGQALFSNSTGGIFWQAPAGSGTVTNVAPANGIMTQPNPIVGAGNVYAVAGVGMVVNAGGINVNAGGSIVANTTGLFVNVAGTSGLVANATGLWVAPAGSIAVGATVAVNTGTNGGLVANATGLWVSPGGSIKVGASGVEVNAAATSSLAANSTGLWVLVGNGHTVNSTGYIAVNSSLTISVNTTGTFVNLASSPGLTGASGLAVSPGPSIAVGATTTVNLATTSGLGIASGLTVTAGQGVVINSTGTHANLAVSPGLAFTSGGLGVSPGSAIAVGATTQVNLAATSGLSTASGLAVVTNTSQFVVAAGGITCNSTGNLTIQDLTCQGNLIVSGTLVTLDATNLQVKDNMIMLCDGQAATASFNDLVDSGFFMTTGNTATTYYSGLARIKNSSTNTNPLFQLFSYTGTAPNSTVLPAVTTGTLQSFLAPWGAGGLLVCNGTNISLSSNSLVALAIAGGATTTIAAGTLTLTTPMSLSYLANSGVEGSILQSNTTSAVPYWSATLDGGLF